MALTVGTKWYVKEGDFGGYLTEQLLDENREPVDLSLATVAFTMRRSTDGEAYVDGGAAEVVGDPLDGIVRYQWTDGDTAEPGEFRFEWRVTFSTDQIQTFPSNGYNTVEVLRHLNG